MQPQPAVLLSAVFRAKRLTLSFLWYTRRFAVCSDGTLRRYDGELLRHTSAITSTTSVARLGESDFTVAFLQPGLRYHIRAASSAERNAWVDTITGIIAHASTLAAAAVAVPAQHAAPVINAATSTTNAFSSPAAPPPAINFATEWLDEHGNVCPKAVDYASQCPKGHGLVALTDAGGGASAHRVMCRVCHSFTERDHAPQWLTCSVTGCCAGYAVCDCCVSALQQAPPAAAGGNHSPSQVCGAEDTHVNIVAG